MKKLPRIIKVHQLKPGDRFSEIPAAWYGPGVVTESYGDRIDMGKDWTFSPRIHGTWCIKFDNDKVVNPPGVFYCNPDVKVRLLKRGRHGKQRSK